MAERYAHQRRCKRHVVHLAYVLELPGEISSLCAHKVPIPPDDEWTHIDAAVTCVDCRRLLLLDDDDDEGDE